VHVLAIGAIWQIALRFRLEGAVPVWVAYPVLIAGAVATGVVFNYLVEKPAIAFARRLLTRRPAAAAPIAG
jgi:hypothetical protein